MSTFLSLLPIYIFGNLHCIGMCGPLVLMLGRHRYRNFYFLGRTLSFSCAGALAGGLGAVLQSFLHLFHLSAMASFLFGSLILLFGILTLFKINLRLAPKQKGIFQKMNNHLSFLILRDTPLAVFLFGFFTIVLPCGQTVVVYSALALEGNLWIGFINGLLFALFTSPALFFAMRAQNFLRSLKGYYNIVFGICALLVGTLALFRGLAEIEMIPHLVLNPQSAPEYHIALY
jgi:sulfite exporter TauE/SafE